jgi:hypothetical protein
MEHSQFLTLFGVSSEKVAHSTDCDDDAELLASLADVEGLPDARPERQMQASVSGDCITASSPRYQKPASCSNANITPKSSWQRIYRTGDGNCMFYSLLSSNDVFAATQLRHHIATWIMEHQSTVLGGLSVTQWIKELMHAKMTVVQYVKELRETLSGGILEMYVVAHLCNWAIVAFMNHDEDHYVEWVNIIPPLTNMAEVKYILFAILMNYGQ